MTPNKVCAPYIHFLSLSSLADIHAMEAPIQPGISSIDA